MCGEWTQASRFYYKISRNITVHWKEAQLQEVPTNAQNSTENESIKDTL